uniref:Nucleotide-diphospho-sugar transferase domain-containing protein n=1 Tax=Chrysotila carterae TaxID=13221 RepID=A0A7S4FAG9_CHRCT|mmetsp:Transcript_26753/g.58738  ORF Transcript_26753/g.58738 Transcript_26753/m.58738 type:complete len:320 (-) Transcript_26753:309-1268(-)
MARKTVNCSIGLILSLMGVPAASRKHANSSHEWPSFVLEQNTSAIKENLTRLEEFLAFAYIAVGNESATEPFLLLSLSTLRRVGGWRGDTFVVTDRAECIPPSARAVVVPPAPTGSDETAKVKYGKHFKQRLLHVLPLSQRHRYVFFTDIDIFIGSAVGPFLLNAVEDFEASKAAIGLFREGAGLNGQIDYNASPGEKHKSLYHSGLLLLSRDAASSACLQDWSVWYTSFRDKDQPQLTKSVNAGACNVSLLDQKSYAQPTADNAGTYWTFNHFTRSGRMQGREGVHSDQLTLAGEVLLGLDAELAKRWWSSTSPLCES